MSVSHWGVLQDLHKDSLPPADQTSGTPVSCVGSNIRYPRPSTLRVEWDTSSFRVRTDPESKKRYIFRHSVPSRREGARTTEPDDVDHVPEGVDGSRP